MPVLAKPRHEAFAKGLAQGMRQVDAYLAAGYPQGSTTPSCASQLANRPQVAARVLELHAEKVRALKEVGVLDTPLAGDETTREWLILQLKENLDIAQRTGKIAMANKAIELIAQLTGFLKPSSSVPPPQAKPAVPGAPVPGGPPVIDPAALNAAFAAMQAAPAESEEDDEEE